MSSRRSSRKSSIKSIKSRSSTLSNEEEIILCKYSLDVLKLINLREHSTNESNVFEITVRHNNTILEPDQIENERFQLGTINDEVVLNTTQSIQVDAKNKDNIWDLFGNPFQVSLLMYESSKSDAKTILGHLCIDTTALLNDNVDEDNSISGVAYFQPDQYVVTTLKRKIQLYYRVYCDKRLISNKFRDSAKTLSLFIGSIFNLDSEMIENENEYEIGFSFPNEFTFSKPILFKSSQVNAVTEIPDFKKWNVLSSQLKGRGSYCADSKYDAPTDVDPAAKVVNFNLIYKNYLPAKTVEILSDHLDKNLKFAIELKIIDGQEKDNEQRYIGFIYPKLLQRVGKTKESFQVNFLKYRSGLLTKYCGDIKSVFDDNSDNLSNNNGSSAESAPSTEEEYFLNDDDQKIQLYIELELNKSFIKTQNEQIDNFVDSLKFADAETNLYKKQFDNQIGTIIKELRTYFSDSYGLTEEDKLNLFDKLQNNGTFFDMKMFLFGDLRNIVNGAIDIEHEMLANGKKYEDIIIEGFIHLKRLCEDFICDLKKEHVDIREYRIFMAKELQELNQLNHANHQYLLNMEEFKFSEETLIDYAIYNLTIFDFNKATEIITYILKVNEKSYLGILLNAYILYKTHSFVKCEEMLLHLTAIHPGFLEGWITLFLFYIGIDSKKATDELLKRVMKKKSTVKLDLYKRNEINWHSDILQPYDFFTEAIVLYIKLGCYNFAELGISESFLLCNPNNDYLKYLLAVIDYLKHDWCNSIKHIRKTSVQLISEENCNDNSAILLEVYRIKYLHQLLNYNLEEFDKCIPELTDMFAKKYDHMIGIRLGNYHFKCKNYCKAIEYYAECCVKSPTYTSYMGLGKSYFKINEMQLACSSFGKATEIDPSAADPYIYLCIIYSCLSNPEKFSLCYKCVKMNTVYHEYLKSKIEWLDRKASLSGNMNTFPIPQNDITI